MQSPLTRWTLPLLVLGALASPAAAQEASRSLERGDEVRVVAPSVHAHRIQGTLVTYFDDQVTIRQPGSGEVYAVPLTAIRKFSKNEGRNRSGSVVRAARLAGFVGGALGFATGPLIATTQHPDYYALTVVASGVGGLVLGTGLGAGVGAVFVRDHWQAYTVPSLDTRASGARSETRDASR
jgi:hypothetical protein